MNTTLKITATAIALNISSVYAADTSPLNSSLYYDIGGGEVINFPLTRSNPTKIGIDASLKLPSLCELWDQKHEFNLENYAKMVEEYAKGELDKLGEQVVQFLITAPATIAVATLQRALPGMYDYSQNLKAQMDVSVDYAKKSCGQVVEDMDNGANPWGGWLTASTSMAWKNQFEAGINADGSVAEAAPNILQAEKTINEIHGETSVPWFGGTAGGAGSDQGAIELVKDVVSAGFAATQQTTYEGENITVTEKQSDYKNINGGTVKKNNRMEALFPNSNAAAKFAQDVLGEQIVDFCEECDGGFTPGTGLKPQFAIERDKLAEAWSNLLTSYTALNPPTLEAFKKVSSQKVAITKPIWQALLGMKKQDRDLFIYRLIGDVATENTIEKAIALRQMFKSGINTPQVQTYKVAEESAEKYVVQLKNEVDDFLWEISTQEALASKTAGKILMADTIENLNDLRAIQTYTGTKNSSRMTSQGPAK